VRSYILVKIPDAVDPVERGDKYDDPMTSALTGAGVGVFNGGGTVASGGKIEGCYLDIELSDRDRGLEVIRGVLREAKAPIATSIEEYAPNEFVATLAKKMPNQAPEPMPLKRHGSS